MRFFIDKTTQRKALFKRIKIQKISYLFIKMQTWIFRKIEILLSGIIKIALVIIVDFWKAIHCRSDTSRTGAEDLSFYYPRLLHCLNQMLDCLISQHRVLSSKTVRPRAPCGARCMGHAIRTWSAVCSAAPHSQFDEGARPQLCMEE